MREKQRPMKTLRKEKKKSTRERKRTTEREGEGGHETVEGWPQFKVETQQSWASP